MIDRFRFVARSVGSRSTVPRRSETTEHAAAIDEAEGASAKAHEVVAGFESRQTDELARRSGKARGEGA